MDKPKFNLSKEMMEGIDSLVQMWMFAFDRTMNMTDGASGISRVCANEITKIILFGQPAKKEEPKPSKLLNPDGTLNLNEWLKGMGDK